MEFDFMAVKIVASSITTDVRNYAWRLLSGDSIWRPGYASRAVMETSWFAFQVSVAQPVPCSAPKRGDSCVEEYDVLLTPCTVTEWNTNYWRIIV